MNIFKPSVLFILAFVFALDLRAELPKDLLKKMLKASSAFETYNITYTRTFKYPADQDTVKELYQSSVSRTDVDMYVGWHKISYSRTATPRSLVAANNSEIARLNYKENVYFARYYKDQASVFIKNLSTYIYQPFLYSKEALNRFAVKTEAADAYVLIQTDTSFDAKKRITLITTSQLTVSKNSYLPTKLEVVSVRGKSVQYAAYELLTYEILSNKAYTNILQQSDSFLTIIKQAPNGDSLKPVKKNLYQTIKTGDTLRPFSGVNMDGQSIQVTGDLDSIILLDFFYTTCSPCIAAIPEINKVSEQYKDKGITVVGLNPFNTDWDHLNNFINDYSIVYQILKTDKRVVYQYGVTGFPRLFVIKNGIIVKIYYGFAKGMDTDLIKLIESIK